MTITEFLEARITEDEVSATLREIHRDNCDWFPDESGYSYPCDCGIPERMAAECAAKRAIVAGHRIIPDPEGDAMDDTCAMCTDAGPEAQSWPCFTLRALAAIYASHPEYLPEWVL